MEVHIIPLRYLKSVKAARQHVMPHTRQNENSNIMYMTDRDCE